MKKAILGLMGIVTILTLTLGVHTSVDEQQTTTLVKAMADGNTGG
ncbi:Phr family secreted Rap phosphatase inhibitor [Bacillus bingmayongensis]|nr:Phr family secreted Rap phosphatase inhibitor [Bacillus bingmayongensis]MBY0600175.1 Phr family secreted Rap phosphatase inhibitor [Bacillus bingmayongensis]